MRDDDTGAFFDGCLHGIPFMKLSEQLLVDRTRSDKRVVLSDCFRDFRIREILVHGTCSKRRTIERRLEQVEQRADGKWALVRYTGATMRDRRGKAEEEWEPDWTDEVLATKRIKYSSAYRGGMEQTEAAPRDTWTYPGNLGSEVLEEAFVRCRV